MNELVKRMVIHLPVLKKQYADKERLRREVAEVEQGIQIVHNITGI